MCEKVFSLQTTDGKLLAINTVAKTKMISDKQ